MIDTKQLHTIEGQPRLPLSGQVIGREPAWWINLEAPWMDRAYDYAHAVAVAPVMTTDAHWQQICRYTHHGHSLLTDKDTFWNIQQPPLVILLRGAPGSGKSTWAARYKVRYPDETVVISATDYFRDTDGQAQFRLDALKISHAWCHCVYTWLMELRVPRIIVDNTHIRSWEITPYWHQAIHYTYRCFQHVCTGTWQNRTGVSEEKVKEMRRRFEKDTLVPHLLEDEI